MFYRKKSSKKSYKKKTSTSKKRCKVSQCIKKYVKATIHKNIENKQLDYILAGSYMASYYKNTSLFTLSMIPYNQFNTTGSSVSTAQSSRIGNVVKTRKCIFSFALSPGPYDVVFNTKVVPQVVIMYFGKVKNAKPQVPTSTDYAKFFQSGTSTQAPTSTLLDAILVPNTDYFTIYKKLVFKVGFSGSYSPSATATANASWQYQLNNEYKMNIMRKLDLTKYCPKTLKFNDTTTQPTNDGLFCMAWCVPADADYTTVGSRPLIIDYQLHYEYEDA